MCRINPRVDFAFKKLFGSEENKDLLISLINSVVDPRDHVADLELKNPYNLADYKADKLSILDIKARDAKGIWFNVEIQVGEDFDFDKRSIYYWSKLVTSQLTEGRMYKHLEKTICINFMDFDVIGGTKDFHNVYKILNAKTGRSDGMHEMFELHYLELRKFLKEYSELHSALDRWMTFLTKAHLLCKGELPQGLRGDVAIAKAVEAVDRMFDEEERAIYQVRLEKQMELESKIASALDAGWEKGREKGRDEGREEGREEGEKTKAIASAKIMKIDGLDLKTIAKYTELPLDEIERL